MKLSKQIRITVTVAGGVVAVIFFLLLCHAGQVRAETTFHTVKDDAVTWLQTNITADALTCSVSDASRFPGASEVPFWVAIWQEGGNAIEKVEVTAVSGNTFTIGRAKLGTTAQAWAAASVVEQLAFSANVTELQDAINSISGSGHTQNTDTALGAQTEDLEMNTHKIIGVTDPASAQDAATKNYVDARAPKAFYAFQFPAQQGYPTLANGCGPVAVYTDTTYFWGLPFDKASDESAFWQFVAPLLPATKTCTFYVYGYIATPEAHNAILDVTIIDRSDGAADAVATAFSAACNGTDKYYRWDLSTAFGTPMTGLLSNKLYTLRLTRDANNGSDNLDQDLIILGVGLEISGVM